VPFVPPDSNERSLTEVLAFIQDEDSCSRDQAFKQLCEMAPRSRKWLWGVVWADRQPPRQSVHLPITQPSDNVGPFGGWDHAKLEADDRVRFGNSPARHVKVAPWQGFLAMWEAHQQQGTTPESAVEGVSARRETLSGTSSTQAKKALTVYGSIPVGINTERWTNIRPLYAARVAELGHAPPVQTTKLGTEGDREWATKERITRVEIAALRRDILGEVRRGRPKVIRQE
jgi:hypothetical protein